MSVLPKHAPPFVITREALQDGSLIAAIRARASVAMPVRSQAELDESLDAVLATHDPCLDVLLFGYGSLMWNPAFHYAEACLGGLRGWRRRFCLRMPLGRGSPERPGLMLALDRGGACRGMVFRIAAEAARTELSLVWRREMLSGAYLARWVTVTTAAGPARAVTFVVNRNDERYVGNLSEAETACAIANARGDLGSCLAYLEETREKLLSLGVRDAGLERIVAEIERSRRDGRRI